MGAAPRHPPARLAEIEAALGRARPAAEGGAYTRLRTAAALEEASRMAGDAPLAGVTLAVKDLIAVAGWSIGAGSRLRDDAPPETEDAPVVATLRRAGAIVVGAAALHELALGVTGVNAHTGTPVNPLVPEGIPGGSSSGSAVAVADGSARVALSTDTGGSGRIPAALCGVVGFKPAYGTYPLRGVLPLAPTMDHVGVMARSTQDVIRVHEVLGSPVPAARRAPAVGAVEASLGAAEPAVAGAIEDALRRLAAAGCRVRRASVPDAAEVLGPSTAIIFAEAAATHAATRARWEREVGSDVQGRLLAGTRVSGEDYAAALGQRGVLKGRVDGALRDVDVLVTPTVRMRPPALADADDPELPARLVAETRLANLAGLPAITLPVGGPVGLQLMGATDERLLAHAAWIERALA